MGMPLRVRSIGAGLLALALTAPAVLLAQVSDADLADRVAAAVRQYSSFSIFDDISINVSNRAVTLTGKVTMPIKRDEIARNVTKIDGVRSLTNQIEVLPVSGYDADLRQRVAHAIYGNSSFWQYAAMLSPPIHIIVEYGHVTLTGVVNNEVERTLAYSLAQVPGVFGVKNELKLDR